VRGSNSTAGATGSLASLSSGAPVSAAVLIPRVFICVFRQRNDIDLRYGEPLGSWLGVSRRIG